MAARGARKMNGTEEPVGDEGVDKRLRSQARWIYAESAIAALILTVLSFFFAGVLPETARSFRHLSLEQAADFLIRHGYVVLFGWVLLEQLGLPIPAAPLLIVTVDVRIHYFIGSRLFIHSLRRRVPIIRGDIRSRVTPIRSEIQKLSRQLEARSFLISPSVHRKNC